MSRPVLGGEVEADALLAPVGVLEQDVDPAAEVDGAARGQAPHGVAPLDVLDLDHLGAPVGEERRGGGHEGVLGDLQDPDALHDCGHRSSSARAPLQMTLMLDEAVPWPPNGAADQSRRKVDVSVRETVSSGHGSPAGLPGLRRRQPPLRDPGLLHPAPARPATRAPSTTSTSGAAPRSSSRARSASTSPTRPSRSWPGPGAQEEYFRNGNPEGKSYRELIGEPMRCHPRVPGARRPASS